MMEIRPITEDELAVYRAHVGVAFRGRSPAPDEMARWPDVDLERTVGAFEGGALVAAAQAEPFRLTVPGGRVAAGGIAGVMVLPTHRRRGILTELVRRQLAEIRARGEPVAALYTSEGAIYGRFGFGVATYESRQRVARHRSAFRSPVSTAGLRLAALPEAAEAMAGIAAAATDAQPGSVNRPAGWWRWLAASPPPGGPEWQVVLRAEGDGFALYEPRIDFSVPTLDGGSLRVVHLFAGTPAAYAALWRYCLDVDLMDEVVATRRPVDEPVRHLLADPRALETQVWDGLWIRLVDAEAALNARGYPASGRVTLRLADPFCPWNEGVYEVGEGGCRPTRAEPELVLTADALAACYLGGNRFSTLARAGIVEERREGAAERADALFASPRAPWCAYHF